MNAKLRKFPKVVLRSAFCVLRFREARGFTLMELLVALGIFAISVGLIADLFLTASRQQARTVVLSTMHGDARLIMETIARELREGTLDFSSSDTNVLALITAEGESLRFQRVATGDTDRPCPRGAPACLFIGRGTDWAPLTSADVTVDAFQFWRTPSADPNVWDAAKGQYQSDQQPRVTVHLTLSAAGRPGERSTIEAQTTVASRAYKR
jgi:prepilin-type N-terminal cleavage/methylation domain-containing protein